MLVPTFFFPFFFFYPFHCQWYHEYGAFWLKQTLHNDSWTQKLQYFLMKKTKCLRLKISVEKITNWDHCSSFSGFVSFQIQTEDKLASWEKFHFISSNSSVVSVSIHSWIHEWIKVRSFFDYKKIYNSNIEVVYLKVQDHRHEEATRRFSESISNR